MIDRDDILKSIEPKSDQLNADDLMAGPIIVKVTDVRKGDADQPLVLFIDGDRQPYKPCKSMRRLIVAIWGDKPKEWIGKRLKLFCDPEVKWGGVKVGGIRIAAMSGINERRSVMLTVTRGKRAEHIVEPLPDAQPEEVRQAIATCREFVGTLSKELLPWDKFVPWVSVVLDRPNIKTAKDLANLTQQDVERMQAAAMELDKVEVETTE